MEYETIENDYGTFRYSEMTAEECTEIQEVEDEKNAAILKQIEEEF